MFLLGRILILSFELGIGYSYIIFALVWVYTDLHLVLMEHVEVVLIER